MTKQCNTVSYQPCCNTCCPRHTQTHSAKSNRRKLPLQESPITTKQSRTTHNKSNVTAYHWTKKEGETNPLKILLPCLVTKSCPTLCDPMDCSPPGSSVYRFSQRRILEWVAISSFRGSFWTKNQTRISCVSCIAGRFFAWWVSLESSK